MRPPAISNAQVPNQDLSPFERFREFARMVVSVPKAEADREMEKSGLRASRAKLSRVKKASKKLKGGSHEQAHPR